MYQFFISANQVLDETMVFIDGSDYNHMKNVVRLKPGEVFRVSVDDLRSFKCELTGYEDNKAYGTIIEKEETSTELSGEIILYQGLPKGDKMELIIQKAVELGASKIIPVSMKNCVVKLDEKKADSKIKRWQAIAEAAAKQSKRSIIPIVGNVITFAQAIEQAKEQTVSLVPYENEGGMAKSKEILAAIKPGDKVGIYIGPEGGFAENEIELARSSCQCVSLGRRILRTETAAITTVSLVMMQMEM